MSEVADLPGQAVQVALTESGGFALYSDGSVWSWGMRANGQLGRTTTERFDGPARIDGLPPMSALAAGHGHVLALDRSGKVWSWGANGAGQLGTGGLSESHKPVKVALPARIKRIGAGDTHSFAVDDMGKLWGWGANNFGQVGEAMSPAFPTAYYTVPHRIKTGFPVALIDAGMFYTVATSAQGDVFAWGWNGMGQLGQESLASSPVPQRIKQLGNVTRLAAGVSHVLAASNAGVYAWGDNRSSACSAFPSVAVQLKPLLVNFA